MNDITRWYDKDEERDSNDVAGKIFGVVDRLEDEQQRTRRARNSYCLGLYENRTIVGTLPGEYEAQAQHLDAPVEERNTLNVSQSVVDTLGSKIATSKPKPMPLTVDGDFELQQKAKEMERFIMGTIHGERAYESGRESWMDGAICDIGAMKTVEDYEGSRVRLERVFPDEIIVDEEAAINGQPRDLFQRKWLPADVLAGMFTKQKEEIREAQTSSTLALRAVTTHLVEVLEAWHLPCSEGAKDGRHCIVVRGCTLADDEWEDEDFPFEFIRWNKRRRGFYGQGLVEQISGLQNELTALMHDTGLAIQIHGRPCLLVDEQSGVKIDHLSNSPALIIKYKGGPGMKPELSTHATSHPEVMQRINFIFEKVYEISGLSQLSAQSKKPAGIESGVALRTLLDSESQRFSLAIEMWQDFWLGIARKIIDAARRMSRAGKPPKAVLGARHAARTINWSEVDLDRDRYQLQLWPTNLLPDTPAGKLAYVEQMITMGLLDPQEGKSLLDYPDIDASNSLSNASREDLMRMIDQFLMDGEDAYIPPDLELMNLELGIRLMQEAWLRGRVNGYEEWRLQPLVNWVREAKRLLQAAQQPPPAPPAEMMPPGPQMMPPMDMPPVEMLPPDSLPPVEMVPPPGPVPQM